MQQARVLPLLKQTRHDYSVALEITHAWTTDPWCRDVIGNSYMRWKTFEWAVELKRVSVFAVTDLMLFDYSTSFKMHSHGHNDPSTFGDSGRHAHLYCEFEMVTIFAFGEGFGEVRVTNWGTGPC
jgi:hypothetical protein